jgi:uncharacterized membrane protein HdeD (DUF308 family)
MNGAQKQAVCFGTLLVGLYAIYMLTHPNADGAVLSMFVGALSLYGGYQLRGQLERQT